MGTTKAQRELSALKRIARSSSGTEPIARDIFRSLLRRGLVYDTMHVYERVEWGRVVARLPIAGITETGRDTLTRASEGR